MVASECVCLHLHVHILTDKEKKCGVIHCHISLLNVQLRCSCVVYHSTLNVSCVHPHFLFSHRLKTDRGSLPWLLPV